MLLISEVWQYTVYKIEYPHEMEVQSHHKYNQICDIAHLFIVRLICIHFVISW